MKWNSPYHFNTLQILDKLLMLYSYKVPNKNTDLVWAMLKKHSIWLFELIRLMNLLIKWNVLLKVQRKNYLTNRKILIICILVIYYGYNIKVDNQIDTNWVVNL